MLGPILSAGVKGGAVVAGYACPGSCNRRWREAREAYAQALALYDPLDKDQSRPQPPEIPPVPGEPVWCPRDASRISQQLAELDYAASLLAAAADGYTSSTGEQRVSGSPAHPSPSPAGDDLDELVSMLTGWEDAYRDARGWPSGARKGSLASRLTECVAWLGQHLGGAGQPGILTHDGISGPFGEEIGTWHREIVAKAKAGTRRIRKPLRCPGCGLLTLIWDEGEPDVKCGNPDCGVIMAYAEYMAEVSRRAGISQAVA
jgi:hypothetical protein